MVKTEDTSQICEMTIEDVSRAQEDYIFEALEPLQSSSKCPIITAQLLCLKSYNTIW